MDQALIHAAATPTHIPFLREAMLLLAVAGIIVPFFQRIKLSPVLAYLLAGIFFGPFWLGAVLPAAHPLSFL